MREYFHKKITVSTTTGPGAIFFRGHGNGDDDWNAAGRGAAGSHLRFRGGFLNGIICMVYVPNKWIILGMYIPMISYIYICTK